MWYFEDKKDFARSKSTLPLTKVKLTLSSISRNLNLYGMLKMSFRIVHFKCDPSLNDFLDHLFLTIIHLRNVKQVLVPIVKKIIFLTNLF